MLKLSESLNEDESSKVAKSSDNIIYKTLKDISSNFQEKKLPFKKRKLELKSKIEQSNPNQIELDRINKPHHFGYNLEKAKNDKNSKTNEVKNQNNKELNDVFSEQSNNQKDNENKNNVNLNKRPNSNQEKNPFQGDHQNEILPFKKRMIENQNFPVSNGNEYLLHLDTSDQSHVWKGNQKDSLLNRITSEQLNVLRPEDFLFNRNPEPSLRNLMDSVQSGSNIWHPEISSLNPDQEHSTTNYGITKNIFREPHIDVVNLPRILESPLRFIPRRTFFRHK